MDWINKSALMHISLLLTGCVALAPTQPPATQMEVTHTFGVTQLSYSHSGRELASGGFQGDLVVWSAHEGEKHVGYRPHPDAVRGLAWVDESTLVSAGEEGRLVLTRKHDGHILAEQFTGAEISSLVFAREQARIYVGHRDGWIRAYELPGLKSIQRYKLAGEVLALAEQGGLIAASTDRGEVVIMSLSLELKQRMDPPANDAVSLTFSRDGKTLVAGA